MMNYESLKQQISQYANRSDSIFIDAIKDFIAMGQVRIWREAKDLGFQIIRRTGKFTIDRALVEKPKDWNKTISFMYGSDKNYSVEYNPLYFRTYEFCRAYWPNSSSSVNPKTKLRDSPPLFYSDCPNIESFEGPEKYFFISPTPDQTYLYELIFLSVVEAITETKTTNLLTDKFPDLLFYACFLEALAYLKDDERIQIYEANYARALQSVNTQNAERMSDRTSNREVS